MANEENKENIKLDFSISNFYFTGMLKLLIKIVDMKMIRKHKTPDVKNISSIIASIYLLSKDEIIRKQDFTLTEEEQTALKGVKETLKEYLED